MSVIRMPCENMINNNILDIYLIYKVKLSIHIYLTSIGNRVKSDIN